MANRYRADPKPVKNNTQTAEVNLTQDFQDYSEFLPNINRTESIQRFFGSTVNQLLSSGSTQSIDTYWGRLAGRNYNPDNILFEPEDDATRLNYQFQPGIVRKDQGNTAETVSYINWLDRLESLGADLANHDRVFSEPGYTLDVPVNADMMINYYNYYWLEGNIPLVVIEPTVTNPIDIDDITRVSQYTTPELGNYRTVEFVNGLRVQFIGPYASSTSGNAYPGSIYSVENVGGVGGIELVELVNENGRDVFPVVTPYYIETPEGWDTVDWDTTPWDGPGTFDEYDVETTFTRDDLTLNKSYIVMERWARDKNPWARSNRWFSADAIRIAAEYNDIDPRAYLNRRTRAERPIIEYRANMELYNTCKNFYESVDYVITLDQVSEILAGNANYLVDPFNALQNGDVVLVVEGNIDVSDPGPYSAAFSRAFNLGSDASIVNAAFTVGGVGTNITLTPKSVYSADDYVIVLRGESRGEIWCFDGTEWSLGQTKSERGQHPLFKLYDDEKTDLETYPDTDFAGEKVFGYEFNTTGAFDRVLGFAPAFTNQGSFANYRFEWTLNNTRYRQNIVDENDEEIRGYYFWRDWVRDDYYNGWSNIRGAQRVPVIQTTVSDGVTPVEFELGTIGYGHPTEFTVSLVDGKYRWHSHSYMDLVSVGYENPEFIWKYDTEYTINDLISDSANKLEFTDPFGGTANINVTIVSDVLITVSIDPAYEYSVVHYRDQADSTNRGEIHLSDENQNRIMVQRNGQILDEGRDYDVVGSTLTVTADLENNDVVELMYIADSDLENVVYDVAPVHFYNSENRPFTGAGYDDFINHFRRQLYAMPGFVGDVQGVNNYHRTLRQHTHDGLIRQQIYRTSHIQYLLDQESINPIRALKTNARDYSEFKRFFRNKVQQLWEKEEWDSIRELVDRAMNDINLGKGEDFKYAHSDMAYSKQFNSLIYSITPAGEDTFALPRAISKYGDTQNHVQVWLSEYDVGTNSYLERPLQKGVDYTIDGLSIILTSPAAVKPADVVSGGVPVVFNTEQVVTSEVIDGSATLTIRWYDYVHLSHVPYSAVKLGFFKPTQIEVVDGELIGHDGSRYTLANTNITDITGPDFDVVGAALWDFELRVFNNLVDKHFVDDNLPADMRDFYPNPVGEFAYDVGDLTVRLDDWYNRYALREGIEEIDVIDYNGLDEFTWNYSSIIPGVGSWRSLYVYTFGTDRPHTHPWEMLGHSIKPTWWNATYSWDAGPLRDALLNALKYGITGNATTPNHVDIRYARSSYDWDNEVLVTDDGTATLNPPVAAGVVSLPTNVDAARDFVFGDWSETENVWRKSSEYLFALAEVYLQLKPYRAFETFWSLDRWNVNTGVTQEQWVNPDTCVRQDRGEIHNQLITSGVIGNIRVILPGTGYTSLDLDLKQGVTCSDRATVTAYTSGGGVTAVAVENPGRGFVGEPEVEITANVGADGEVELEYVVDREFVVTHLGFNTLSAEEFRVDERYTNDLAARLDNLEYEYCIHVGGYTDKRILSLELAGEHNDGGQIRIPESSYDIVIDRNAPNTIVFYSGVRIQKIEGRGYLVDGYNLDSRFFNYLRPSTGGSQTSVQIGDVEVIKHLNWRNEVSRVPYRTIFRKRQELYQFLLGLGKYYESVGFDAFTEWEIDARAAIVWSLSDETEDLFVNGMSDNLVYNQGNRGVVQTIDVNYDGVLNVLDETYQAIRRNELFVLRNEETTEFAPKSSNRRIYGLGVRVVEFEHIITLDNVTTFNDPIYQPELGIGQNRIRLVGERTRNWNGRVEAPGYIVRNTGLVSNFETSVREIERDWISSESKALERLTRQTIGYNVGYIKPTYMTNTFVGDVSAYRFEKGERKYQGTAEAIAAMARNKNIFGSEFEHEFYEEWMVRLGDYGDISEREPLQFEVDRNKIKGDPQHFRFNDNFVSDREDDLIIDISDGGAEAINGNYSSPFDVLPVLRLGENKITNLDQFQTFTRDAGLPLTTEVDAYSLSIDNIGDVYDPTAEYATIPNWSRLAAYVQGDIVRYQGYVWELNVGTTGLTTTSNDLSFRATQSFPTVQNGRTFIANGETVVFIKTSEVTTNNLINVDGTLPLPSTSSGSTLVLDGRNVNFIKTVTTIEYGNIALTGNVTNPTIQNSANRELSIFYADSAGAGLTEVVVEFDELLTTNTAQQIWIDALTEAGATSVNTVAANRISALQALQTAYVAANSANDWENFIGNYYNTALSPDRILNPESLGTQVNANIGASWETAARDLIQLDLDLIADIGGAHAETVATMVSGSLNNTAQFESSRDSANNLLDVFITNNNANQNLQDFIAFVEGNGGTTISNGLIIIVTNPNRYVVDTLASIKTKIDSALVAANAPSTISTTITGNVLTLIREDNEEGFRLGVSTDNDLGFTAADNDVETQGSTTTGSVALNLNEVVTAINNAGITGVTAVERNNILRITSSNPTLTIGNGTANSLLGIGAGTYQASQTIEDRPVDLNINDVVAQINEAEIPNLTASQIEGVLVISYTGDRLEIGDGTANSALGITPNVFDSRNDTVSNIFDPEDWTVVEDPLNLNVWVVDNIGSEPGASGLSSNRYDVYQALDFDLGILQICPGNESGDDALIKLDRLSGQGLEVHNLEVGEFVFIVNSTCIPSVDGIHRVTRVDDQQNFYIDRYIEEEGFTGKVFPLRSMRFANTAEALTAMEDPRYFRAAGDDIAEINDDLSPESTLADRDAFPRLTGGVRNGDYVFVDNYQEVVEDVADEEQGFGAVYQVSVSDNQAILTLVRVEKGKTDNSQIRNGVLHDNASGDTIIEFEVYDPLKGIIPGIADREIDIKSEFDAAYYNNTTDPDGEINLANFWGQEQVGTVWWDLTTAIYLNYDQSTPEYRQRHWGQLFPGALIDVYEWTKSPVAPDQYAGVVSQDTVVDGQLLTGVPYAQIDQFGEPQYYWSEENEINPITGQVETYFYFWVRGKTTLPNVERQFSVLQLEELIVDPARQEVDWLAATSENTLLVSSLDTTTGYPELVMTVNYDVNASDYHQEYLLLAEGDPSTIINEWLHISLRDSLAGYTQATGVYPWSQWEAGTTYLVGQIVRSGTGVFFRCHTESTGVNPDTDVNNDFWTQLEDVQLNPEGDIVSLDYVEVEEPQNIPDLKLHPFVRQGLQVRPHQTWFEDINGGRRAIVEKINSQLIGINLLSSDIPWRASFDREVNLGNGFVYDLRDYWDFADWKVPGYEYNRSVGNFFLEERTELASLTPSEDNIAHVEVSIDFDGRNRREVYQYTAGEWQLIFKEKATIQFNDLLWDNELLQGGWDIADWDTTEWDRASSGLMVEIFNEFYYNIWIEERRPLYTDLWFAAVKYVLREQGEPDWIFKTSYFKVIVEDELEKIYNKFFTENVEDLIDYIETVKPFRSKLRDAIVRKVADDDAEVDIDDAIEIRIQTNPLLGANNGFSGGFDIGYDGGETAQNLSQGIVDPFTRAFRLNVGRNGNNYSSKIINDRKVLLGMDIGPFDAVIPVLTIGDGDLPDPAVTGETEAAWINGERITYTGMGQLNTVAINSGFSNGFWNQSFSGSGSGSTEGVGSGFTSGFAQGFSGVTVLTGVTRGTQGTFARGHSYADIIEGVGTDAELIENTTLSDWGNDLYPAWQPLGSGLLDSTNQTPNGLHMRGADKLLEITNISNTNPAVVTVSDTSMLTTGMVVGIQDVESMPEINDRSYTITVINGTQFSLDGVDSTSYGTYTATCGGVSSDSTEVTVDSTEVTVDDGCDTNGIVDYGACFGTIEPWGNILWAQIIARSETADAIAQWQDELEELIEEFWF
jgi:hypothetical protein